MLPTVGVPPKAQVLEFSGLVCADGEPVGKRGAATIFSRLAAEDVGAEEGGRFLQSLQAAGSYHAPRARLLAETSFIWDVY